MITLDDCPSVDRLREFLDDSLDAASASNLETHVEQCQHCQTQLDRFTRDGAVLPAEPQRFRFEPANDFLEDLRNAPAAMQEAGPIAFPIIPGFALMRELGRGGMGVVYLARQMALDRLVAVKMLHASASAESRGRFQRESQAVARLRHPGIVTLLEIGESAAGPYLVFEYIDGLPLDQLTKSAPQEPRSAALMVEQLAQAVHAAHSAGVVHRDLKPSNVLIGSDQKPRITDFGLAKILSQTDAVTRSGQLLGTPSYVAPEQIAGFGGGSEVTPATDVYALGAILYELLTGRPPFRASLPVDTLLQVLHRDPVAPSRLVPTVPRDIETVCLTCLEKNPSKRYGSALDLAEDLARFREGLPVRARPLGRVGQALRWSSRHRALSALIAIASLGLLTASVGFGLMWREAERRAAAEQNVTKGIRRRAAELAIDRHLAICEQGEVARGLIGLNAVASELTPDDADLNWLIRVNRNAWKPYQVTPRLRIPHASAVKRIAFLDEGRLLATLAADGVVRVWNAQSGNRVGEEIHHPGGSRMLIAAPQQSMVLTSGLDGNAQLWDVRSSQAIRRFQHGSPIVAAAFAEKSSRLITGGSDGTLLVWDTDSGMKVGEAGPQQTEPIHAVALSHDGRQALTTSGSTALMWDVATGATIGNTVRHRGPIGFAAFAPEAPGWLVGGTTTLAGMLRPLEPHGKLRPLSINNGITAMSYEPHGDYVACGGGASEYARGVAVYRLNEPQIVARLFTFESQVHSVAIGPGGRQLLAAGDHWRATMYLEPYDRTMLLRLDHPADVTAMAFAPAAALIATAAAIAENSPLAAVTLWDAPPDVSPNPVFKHTNAKTILFGNDGELISTDDTTVRFWNGQTYQTLPGSAITPIRTGELLWIASGSTLKAHNLRTGQATGQTIVVGERIERMTADPKGRLIALTTLRGIELFDAATGRSISQVLTGEDKITAMQFAPDGRILITGDSNGGLAFRILPGCVTMLYRARVEGSVRAIAFDPSGRKLAVSGSDKTVRFIDPENGCDLGDPLLCQEIITQLAWHPNSRMIAIVCLNGVVRLWDSGSSRPIGPSLLWRANSVIFTPDGRTLLFASDEHPIRGLPVPAAE